jgi:NAD(P)-dependent dehydrogenase (short-subunit alcohol dehydrogenase family)
MRLKDEVAVITGAGSGIGRETALLFAREGASVVVADVDEDNGQETAEQIRSQGSPATFVRADVTSESDVAGLFDTAESTYGRVSVLFNNAGRMIRGPVTEIDVDAFSRALSLNVIGVALGCKHGVPALRRNGGGAIVNTASAASLIGLPNASAYCATKGAVLQFTRAVAAELVNDGIRVNAVCPGLIDTAFYAPDYSGEAAHRQFVEAQGMRAPMGRMGQPHEIAEAVVYLASSSASYVTGAALSVDGGITAV